MGKPSLKKSNQLQVLLVIVLVGILVLSLGVYFFGTPAGQKNLGDVSKAIASGSQSVPTGGTAGFEKLSEKTNPFKGTASPFYDNPFGEST